MDAVQSVPGVETSLGTGTHRDDHRAVLLPHEDRIRLNRSPVGHEHHGGARKLLYLLAEGEAFREVTVDDLQRAELWLLLNQPLKFCRIGPRRREMVVLD